MRQTEFSKQNTTLWCQNSVPRSPDQIPDLLSYEYRVWQSAQGISALFLMLVYAFSKRENWTTESLTEDQVCLCLHPCQKGHLPVERLTDPSRLQWSLLSPEPVAPFIFLSTTLPFCSSPSNEEVQQRHRHNTPLHKEGMSVCQMGRGDYNMFPLP